MAKQIEDTGPHSTLEVADRHSIVGGLQHDHDTNAPELDRAAYAPQVAFDPEPKIPALSLPEAINNPDGDLQAVGKSQGGHKHNRHGLSRRVEISIIVILVVSVLTAAGIGVGVGLTNKKPKSTPTAASSSAQTNAASTLSPNSQPSAVSASNHLILNDSSLSALSITGGGRTVLFQDQIGIIRQANYNTSAKKWSMASAPAVASGPKNFTPLALAHNPNTTDDTIHLFYIATSNNLAFVVYDTFNGSWSNHTELVDSDGLPFRAAKNSRTLLAKRLGVSTTLSLQVLIHYENADGNLTILEGSNTPPSIGWAMQDVTGKLNSSLRPQGILRVPCSSMRYGNAVRLISTDQTGATLSEKSTTITVDYEDGKFNSTSEENVFDPISVGESDLQIGSNASQIYGFWVNGTRLASFNTVPSSPNLQTLPESSFPYVRLAGINPNNGGSSYYLYNQISADALVQYLWDLNLGSWTPSKINITEI